MNGIDEISKKRLYIEGLKQAIALPLPEELSRDLEEIFQDDETEEDIKETMRFWIEVEGPFCNAIVFVHNNRFLVEEKDAILNGDEETPFMMPDVIFNILRTLLKTTVMEFLSVLQIPSSEKAQLLDCVERDDKTGFSSLLERTQCDTTALAKLCSNCMDCSSTGFEMKGDDLAYYLDHVVSFLKKKESADGEKMLEAVKRFQPSAEVLLADDDSDEALNNYFADYRHFLETDLATNLHYYWDWYDDFTLKERNLIEPILDNPLAVDLVNRIWEDYEAALLGGSFSLPDDFFHSKCAADDTEHLHIKLSVEDKGAELFTEFINYVAEKGYIEDSPAAKNLFAYRLSGYYRPEGNLPPIVWNGRNGKSYELIYLIRYLCDRGDYKKMRRFFEGPEWVKEKDSSYAHSADTEFRRKMAEFYSGVCEFKK
jgi:hypothetical protein